VSSTHASHPSTTSALERAFNYAVDREHLVALAGADLATSTCQFLPPNLAGYHRYCPYMHLGRLDGPYTGPDPAKARRLVTESHTRGATVVLRDVNAQGTTPITRYLVSVLHGLGYRVRFTTGDAKPGDQVAVSRWSIDYPDPSDVLVPVISCGSASNTFHFCDRRVEQEMARAVALETSRPQAAARLWAKVDRDVTDEAPWVPYLNIGSIDIVSQRVGNYIYTAIAQGALYDQLWVR
jgi:peptide/nickel transport system substrate-binding protein